MLNKYKGCLIGLALGDALGAPVEFDSLETIKEHYGENGIQDLADWDGFKAGSYTDDTQMALATARGCIEAAHHWKKVFVFDPLPFVYQEYLKWLKSQDEAFQRRGPGHTCLSALRSGRMGTLDDPINDSKGCGGVMRTAPVGLVYEGAVAFLAGAKYAAITHGHPSGYISAGFLAQLISLLLDDMPLKEAIRKSKRSLLGYIGFEETEEKINEALRLATGKRSDEKAIEILGEGWVGEEALAISLFCALRYPDDYKGGVIAAVNHSGDSDSTGSITGAILGTKLSEDVIPKSWVAQLENLEQIQALAHEMYRIFREEDSDLYNLNK